MSPSAADACLRRADTHVSCALVCVCVCVCVCLCVCLCVRERACVSVHEREKRVVTRCVRMREMRCERNSAANNVWSKHAIDVPHALRSSGITMSGESTKRRRTDATAASHASGRSAMAAAMARPADSRTASALWERYGCVQRARGGPPDWLTALTDRLTG